MKKVVSSIIVILITVICSIYMITYQEPEKNDSADSSKSPKSSNTVIEENKTENQEVDGSTENKTENQADSELKSSESKTESFAKSQKTDVIKSVFKVSKESINISNTDKLKLLYIYKKLDKDDETKITEFLNEEGEDAVKNIFHLLRDRLSDEDYQSVRNITSKFINLDVAEN